MVLGKGKKIEITNYVTKISPNLDREVDYIAYEYEYKGESVWSVFNNVHRNVYLSFGSLNDLLSETWI